jgi:hypothetical protein
LHRGTASHKAFISAGKSYTEKCGQTSVARLANFESLSRCRDWRKTVKMTGNLGEELDVFRNKMALA